MLDARTATGLPVAGLFDGFLDLSAAYRFGPPPAQVVVASLLDNGGNLLAQDFHFPAGLSSERVDDVGLAAAITGRSAEGIELTIHTERLAQHVCIAWPGFVPADNHFHLAPRGARTLSLRGQAAGAARRGTLRALNSRRIITIEDST
jgi:beta-mannosidase